MKNKFPIILLCFILSSCLNNQSKDANQFRSFLKQLNKIDTPITFNSNNEYAIKLLYLKKDPFFNNIQNELGGFGVFGILFETNDFVAILGNIPSDTGTPVIMTFDKNGKKIDSHPVYENVMGDMGRYVHNCETIFPDMKMIFVDSTITRKINKEGSNEIPGTDSLTVTKKSYKIDVKGKIIRTK
jgi:hypothetical protein